MMGKLGMEEGEAIELSSWTKAYWRTHRRKLEQMHFDIGKQLPMYDNVMNQQREAVYSMLRTRRSGDPGRHEGNGSDVARGNHRAVLPSDAESGRPGSTEVQGPFGNGYDDEIAKAGACGERDRDIEPIPERVRAHFHSEGLVHR
ncbi:MAG: hypothetical protein MZU95_07655 [Desulfomicrobium escambiense]|nr:hypothetical protein [Desulfomicrobium escambiense]